MTGIYYRVERDGKWRGIDLSQLTDEELTDALNHCDEEQLIRTISIILLGASREELISIINAYRKKVEEHD